MTQSNVWVAFRPEAWINDYAVGVDCEGDNTWQVSEETAQMMSGGNPYDLDFVRGDEYAPEWIKNWSGPFTIERVHNV